MAFSLLQHRNLVLNYSFQFSNSELPKMLNLCYIYIYIYIETSTMNAVSGLSKYLPDFQNLIKIKVITISSEKVMTSIGSPALSFLLQAVICEVAVATIVQICFCRFCGADKRPNPDSKSIFTHRMPPWLFSRL